MNNVLETGIATCRVINVTENNKNFELSQCLICLNLVWEPVSCESCEALFCSECIHRWLAQKPGLCPQRCNFKKIPPSRLLKNLLSVFRIRCVYQNEGCEQILPYDNLKHHQNNCQFKQKQCSGCKMDFPVETYTEHVESCPEVYISCVNCNHSYERKKKIFHTETDCTLKNLSKEHNKLQLEFNQFKIESQTLTNHKLNNLSEEYNKLQLEFNQFKIESQTLTNQMKSHISTLERNLEALNQVKNKQSGFGQLIQLNNYDRYSGNMLNPCPGNMLNPCPGNMLNPCPGNMLNPYGKAPAGKAKKS